MRVDLSTVRHVDKDGNGYINTDEVRYMLTTLYGMREPPEEDVKRFMKRFDANKDGKISFEEFQKAIPEVQKEVKEELKKNSAASTNSHSSLHRLRRKHVRLNAGPTKKFGTPMTTSQEIGWQQRSTAEKNKNDPQKPKNSCEETVFASDMIKSGIYY
mmetsp:Transcript_21622/g.34905  ORF Transcript_21622/g.34905 Transcript_21622/m.34905 type:complete len:158 (+) Transcript_21622:56-529(+)